MKELFVIALAAVIVGVAGCKTEHDAAIARQFEEMRAAEIIAEPAGVERNARDINQKPYPGAATNSTDSGTSVKSSSDLDKGIDRENESPAAIPEK